MAPRPAFVPSVPFAVPTSWHRKPSPHHAPRVQPVTAIVLHADASAAIESTLAWLADPVSKVSYHVVIGRSGAVFLPVHPDAKAYHAGTSSLDGVAFCNAYSVGVCLSNRNDGHEVFPLMQVAVAVEVCTRLCRHYGIDPDRIVSHAQVATPAGRKTDPLGLDLEKFRDAVRTFLRTTVA